MDSFNDIKQAWLSARVNSLPDASSMVRSIKNYRLKRRFKLIAVFVFTLILIGTMIWVLVDYKSHLITTRIGEVLMFISLFTILSLTIKSLKRLTALNAFSNEAFLQHLKLELVKLLDFQKRIQSTGFFIASFGLLLYIFEGVYRQSSRLFIVYSLVVAWLAVMWFIVRPFSIRKKTKKLNEKIVQLEKIIKQLNN
jgi:hypothetical protein